MGNLIRHILILIMLSLSFPALSFAQKKIAFIVGGVEEEKSDTTVFDADFFNMTSSLMRQGYEVHAFFNGDSKITLEKFVKPFLKYKNFSWAPADYNLLFPEMLKQKLTKDDKLVLVMIGHGSSSNDPKLHSLTIKKEQVLPVGSLETILNNSRIKEAQQVVIDASCFSGHSLILASQNRCVLSSSQSTTLGYFNFLKELAFSIEQNNQCWFCSKDLLSTFLRVRGKVVLSSPMISSFTPMDPTLRSLYKLSSYYLTIENYLYFLRGEDFCRTCYINAFSTFEKQMDEVVHNFQLQQKYLPKFILEGLIAEIRDFFELQKQIVELAKYGPETPAVTKKAKDMIYRSRLLYFKMVSTERNLYDTIMRQAVYQNEIKKNDPCVTFKF